MRGVGTSTGILERGFMLSSLSARSTSETCNSGIRAATMWHTSASGSRYNRTDCTKENELHFGPSSCLFWSESFPNDNHNPKDVKIFPLGTSK